MDHNPQGQGGRRHFHRGRRGPDRRGPDRRGPQQQAQEQPTRAEVDVEQIMRDIRARISQRHGIELTNQQIQELAARRLESILDPRSIKPALLDQLRRAAGTAPDTPAPSQEPAYIFEDTTLYESHRGLMRFIRKLLNPILKLFFNPNPLIRALNIQARINNELLAREAERDRRQAEWNALHYELLHPVVTEIARVTLEAQNVSLRMESLAGKVDFNERRVRGIEGALHQARPSGRREDTRREEVRREVQEIPAPQVVVQPTDVATPEPSAPAQSQPAEGSRRRRRRRRGRRGAAAPGEVVAGVTDTTALEADEPDDEGADEEEGALAPDVDLQVEATSQRMDEIPDFPVDSDSNRMMAETDALVAEALSHEVKEEHTIVVVADEERPRTEPAAFDTMEPQDAVSHEVVPIPEPEAGTEELATPVLPDRRDLEPTDK
jgi:hypothetical protein